jgi:hypothetical protein
MRTGFFICVLLAILVGCAAVPEAKDPVNKRNEKMKEKEIKQQEKGS